MIEFTIPSFLGFKTPRYRCDDGAEMPAVTAGFPALSPPLRRLAERFPDSRRLARNYRHLQFLSWFTGVCAGLNLGLGLLAWHYFRFTVFLPNGAALTALSVSFNFLAYNYFRKMATSLEQHSREQPDAEPGDLGFRHYDVTPHGVFERSGAENNKTISA
jgi:hypothetical protein